MSKMSKLFDQDNMFFAIMGVLFDLIILNVLTLLCCMRGFHLYDSAAGFDGRYVAAILLRMRLTQPVRMRSDNRIRAFLMRYRFLCDTDIEIAIACFCCLTGRIDMVDFAERIARMHWCSASGRFSYVLNIV